MAITILSSARKPPDANIYIHLPFNKKIILIVKELAGQDEGKNYPTYINVIVVLVATFLFFFSIILIVSSINSFGYSFANYAVSTTANPFVGLFIGLLATALLQSSSTTTTMVVAAVASGTLNLQGAIPIILGANIGTTLTSTIVSMGYITKTNQFRKAVAAGTVHDFFNILMVLMIFPIEMKYRLLERGSRSIVAFLGSEPSGNTSFNFGFVAFFKSINSWLIDYMGSILSLSLAVISLFLCIKFISSLLYRLLIGKTKKKFETTVFSNTFKSFGWGLLLTAVAQSSSLTTSLIVPLVATGKVKLKRAFQFILGANLGTTLTALLAAIFQSNAAISIALVHVLFNAVGVILFLFIPFFSNLVIFLARKFGEYTLKLRIVGFVYILFSFFLAPFSLIYLSQDLEQPKEQPIITPEP